MGGVTNHLLSGMILQVGCHMSLHKQTDPQNVEPPARPKLGICVVELATCRNKFIATLGGALKYVFLYFHPSIFWRK